MKSNSSLSNEDRIILACSAQVLNKEDRIDIINRIAKNKVDWQYILNKAIINGVNSLLYKTLQSINGDRVLIPHKVLGSLKNSYIASSLQNMRLLGDLAKVLKTFNKAGIKIVVIKGASLIERVYKDLAFRGVSDIDIVIQEKDFLIVKDIFKRLNYYTTEYDHFDPTKWSSVPLDYHINFLNKNGTKIEVKFFLWGLDFPDFEIQNLWKEAQIVKIAGQETLIPSPEYSLVIMCTALVRHDFIGLIWYHDIKEIINYYKDNLDWEKIVNLTREKRVGVLVYYGLFFAKRLINAEVPDFVINCLRPNYFRRKVFGLLWNKDAVLNFKEKYIYQGPEIPNRISTEVEMTIFAGKIDFRLNKLSKLLVYVLRAVFSPKHFLAKHYMTTLSPIRLFSYYISRPLRYLLRTLRSIVFLILKKFSF